MQNKIGLFHQELREMAPPHIDASKVAFPVVLAKKLFPTFPI
jgi:hypothetical protein